VPDAHIPGKRVPPMMATTDLALKADPIYREISERFHANPDQLADAFARAWFKLTHRDMGPLSRYVGPLVPAEADLAGPRAGRGPRADRRCRDRCVEAVAPRGGAHRRPTGAHRMGVGASFRGTDKRGGANGARIRLAPQKDWAVNEPEELAAVLQVLEGAAGLQRRAVGRHARVAGRSHRARRLRRRGAGGA
jgi:catalase-peroxidase